MDRGAWWAIRSQGHKELNTTDPLSTHTIIIITVILIVYYCEACTINTRQMLYVFSFP